MITTKIDRHGNKFWYSNGNLHRTDGPAIEYANGAKSWYIDANLHRTNGPAIEYANGDKRWFLNGNEYSFDKFVIKAKWSAEDIVMWKLSDRRLNLGKK